MLSIGVALPKLCTSSAALWAADLLAGAIEAGFLLVRRNDRSNETTAPAKAPRCIMEEPL
jgi:hypothetical protein